MTAQTIHRLDGLEPDNFLAFLALIGLLRSLDLQRPTWLARAHWGFERAPLRPVLTTMVPVTESDLATAAMEAIQLYRRALWPFTWPRSKDGKSKTTSLAKTSERLRVLQIRSLSALNACQRGSIEQQIWRLRCDLLSCTGGIKTQFRQGKQDRVLESSPAKLPSGQMTFIGAQFDLLIATQASDVQQSLFRPWAYAHKGASLRLSPEDARRYAYRASDPSPEGSRAEVGASALASIGLLALTMSEGQRHWRTVGYRGTRKEGTFAWPLWSDLRGRGTSYHGAMALLRAVQPTDQSQPNIRHLVKATAHARRFVLDPNQGDYGNLARASLKLTLEGPEAADRTHWHE